MNAKVKELGLTHTHFANPHGISDERPLHQLLRYGADPALGTGRSRGLRQVFTRNEMYHHGPHQHPARRPATFHQQDKLRIGSSRYHITSVKGSKLGYTNTARYSYACLAEQNGVRLICVTMQSELSTDKYNDVRTLLDYAFSTFTGYTDLPARGVTAQLPVMGGGGSLGTVTVSDPGVRLLSGRRPDRGGCGSGAGAAGDRICLGTEPGGVRSVHRQQAGTKQENDQRPGGSRR